MHYGKSIHHFNLIQIQVLHWNLKGITSSILNVTLLCSLYIVILFCIVVNLLCMVFYVFQLLSHKCKLPLSCFLMKNLIVSTHFVWYLSRWLLFHIVKWVFNLVVQSLNKVLKLTLLCVGLLLLYHIDHVKVWLFWIKASLNHWRLFYY